MIYFWDAGVCPHLSSCECWHVLGTGKVYIAWIPGDWFRATHFEAVGQIKPMPTPLESYHLKQYGLIFRSRAVPSRKPAFSLIPFSAAPPLPGGQRTMGMYWDGVFIFCVCLFCVCLFLGMPECQAHLSHQNMENQSCTAQQPRVLTERWFGVCFALSQRPQTTMRQQVINFCHFLELWPACKTFCPNTNKIWCND